MYIVIYNLPVDPSQDDDLHTINLKRVAEGKGWYVKRSFLDKTHRVSNVDSQSEFKLLIDYCEKTQVDAVMVANISNLGEHVVDVVNRVELLHGKGIALYIYQFDLLTCANGKENPIARMLIHAISIGAEMEKNHRLTKHRHGVNLAKMKGVYRGRKLGAKTSTDTLLEKYSTIVELIEKRELSVRAIARTTNHSINTVRKLKALKS
jgi:DNA invertase Pin-like site-specific DNA recombinase